jgi:aryl-alcohol dehydrogenase-like predicted oxidoreductase
VEYTHLGRTGLKVSRIALGCMSFGDSSRGFNQWSLNEEASQPFFRQAVELGITLWDTANVYQSGSSEEFVGRAIQRYARREEIVVATKVSGKMHEGPGGQGLSRLAIMEQVDASLTRLGTDHIDIYRPARLDPAVPIEETVGAIKEMIDAGYVRHLGLSEVDAATIRRAHAVHPVSDLQIEYSLLSRGVEDDILPTLKELGIGLTAYGVLGRGLLSGHWSPDRTAGPGDSRGFSPRFSSGNVEHNLALVEALRRVAEAKGCTVAQLAIAWVAAQSDTIVPLVGARTRERLAEALPAAALNLTADDLAEIEKAVPAGAARGDRYPAAFMSSLGVGN